MTTEKTPPIWPASNDGIEQDAFEAWAKSQGMNMSTHPLHWLFLDAKTYAARQGWKAGLDHAVTRALGPWENFNGDLPPYDHPLRSVFESGIQYAVDLLAKALGVTDYSPCEGTEEFDGDLGGTMMNIVCAALPENQDGDSMRPDDIPAALAALQTLPPIDVMTTMSEALEWYATYVGKCRMHHSEGEDAHHKLDADCGHRAQNALAHLQARWSGGYWLHLASPVIPES